MKVRTTVINDKLTCLAKMFTSNTGILNNKKAEWLQNVLHTSDLGQIIVYLSLQKTQKVARLNSPL